MAWGNSNTLTKNGELLSHRGLDSYDMGVHIMEYKLGELNLGVLIVGVTKFLAQLSFQNFNDNDDHSFILCFISS